LNTVLLEKMKVPRLFQEFPALFIKQKLITGYIRMNNLIVIPERIFTTQEETWFMELVTKNTFARLLYL